MHRVKWKNLVSVLGVVAVIAVGMTARTLASPQASGYQTSNGRGGRGPLLPDDKGAHPTLPDQARGRGIDSAPEPTSVPEPTTIVLLAAGLALLTWRLRRSFMRPRGHR